MFFVCDPVALGMEHVPFNAALLKTIRLAFPSKKICFYSEHAHGEYVKEQIGLKSSGSIEWRTISLPRRHSSFFERISADFKIVNSLLNKFENPEIDVLVICGIASILWALKYYLRKNHRNKNVQVVIHGDFSTLKRIPRRSILNPFYYIGCLKTALRLPGYDKFQLLVLEESVRQAIIDCMPFLENSLHVFDHPIPDDICKEKDQKSRKSLSRPIQVGFLGRATEKKGISSYIDVAYEISSKFPGQVDFHIVGRISKKIIAKNQFKIKSLSEIPHTDRLSRSEYIEKLNNLHFVCLFYNDYYNYCASGALLDSIEWKKPIIASDLPIFKNIEKQFGDIGYVCKPDEIVKTMESIIRSNNTNRYDLQVKNMTQVRCSRTPETLANKYIDLVGIFASKLPN